MSGADDRWKIYERIVGFFEIENHANTETGVTLNAKIIGAHSGIERQVDCLIDLRFGRDKDRRIIVDAKRYKSKVDINDVERFHGMMIDCEAAKGILVCPSGWTDGAFKRASDLIEIKLLSLEDVENAWEYSVVEECCICNDGVVFYDGNWGMEIGGLLDISCTGKCDRCHSFNIWHWACGDKFAVEDGEKVSCSCNYDWFVIPPEPDAIDDPERMSAFLMVCARQEHEGGLGIAGIALVDSRPG